MMKMKRKAKVSVAMIFMNAKSRDWERLKSTGVF
jgi:hypothetical protein